MKIEEVTMECQPIPTEAAVVEPKPPSQGTDFDLALRELCETLETWTIERKSKLRHSEDEQPPFDKKAASWGIAFLLLYGIGVIAWHFLKGSPHVSAQIILLFGMLITGVIGSVRLFIVAPGFLTRRFWRSFFTCFKNDNYPFTPLLRTLDNDMEAMPRLSKFTLNVLATVEQRLALEESDLRERLVSSIGNPSILVVVGVLAGVSSAWKSFQDETTTLSTIVFFLSVAVLGLAIYAVHLRISIVELTRCRTFVALEIARRKAATG
jgi:hypothetical protein